MRVREAGPMEVFDVAVVGAGSAGCALAARTDWRIALVEAGPDYLRTIVRI